MKNKQIKSIIKEAINSLKKQKLNEQDVVIDTCYVCFTSIPFFNPNSPSFNQSAYDELLPMVDMETGLISGQGIADGNFGLCNVTLSYGANSNIGTQGSFNPSSNAILPCSPPLPPTPPDAATMGGVKPGTQNLATPVKGPAKEPNVSPVGMAPKMPRRGMMREQVERMQKLANIKKKK